MITHATSYPGSYLRSPPAAERPCLGEQRYEPGYEVVLHTGLVCIIRYLKFIQQLWSVCFYWKTTPGKVLKEIGQASQAHGCNDNMGMPNPHYPNTSEIHRALSLVKGNIFTPLPPQPAQNNTFQGKLVSASKTLWVKPLALNIARARGTLGCPVSPGRNLDYLISFFFFKVCRPLTQLLVTVQDQVIKRFLIKDQDLMLQRRLWHQMFSKGYVLLK